MKIVVGLGNPGREYESTRHNIGYMVVEKLARELGKDIPVWQEETKRRAMTVNVGGVLLVKPLTFMNESGAAVKALLDFYKISPDDVMVIHDDIDLPLGKIRIRSGGGSAGHNGVDSIIKILKTDAFVRVRLGIGRGKESTGKQMDKSMHHRSVIDFVLSRFRETEAGALRTLVKNGEEAAHILLLEGIDKAMNRFN